MEPESHGPAGDIREVFPMLPRDWLPSVVGAGRDAVFSREGLDHLILLVQQFDSKFAPGSLEVHKQMPPLESDRPSRYGARAAASIHRCKAVATQHCQACAASSV